MPASPLKSLPAPAPVRPPGDRRALTGWGRTAPSVAEVYRPQSAAEIQALLAAADDRGAVARGLGRCYGDAAQNGGGEVLELTGMHDVIAFDADRGVITVESGVSLDFLIAKLLPMGWFLPVTPGTRHVTVGGAIAADIHGKNHHLDGSFCTHVDSVTLSLPSSTITATPDEHADVFWATAGGMGLTGAITRATIRLLPVTTAFVREDTERADDLDHLLALMESGDERYRYSAAWVDCMARGRHLGRSVLSRGDHADLDDLPPRLRAMALAPRVRPTVAPPSRLPSGLVRRVTMRAFNEMWFRRAPRHETGRIRTLTSFLYPLDGVASWNRVYGASGFLQYQLVVPFGAENVLHTAIENLQHAGTPASLAVLKRFGDGDPGPMSFPIRGWTLALDVPVGHPRLGAELDRLDEMVATAGGRVYLAKDSRMQPEFLSRMYPRLDEWQQVQARLDPDGVFQSDLSRRLRMTRGSARGPGARR